MLLELRVRHGKSSMPSAPLAPETAIAASLHKLLVGTDKATLLVRAAAGTGTGAGAAYHVTRRTSRRQ